MKLTENQINFLLTNFFNNTHESSKEIGLSLITEGRAIVGGNEPLWRGGIGNFIKTKSIGFNCLEYTFDLYLFITSDYFNLYYNGYLDKLNNRLKDIVQEIYELKQLQK